MRVPGHADNHRWAEPASFFGPIPTIHRRCTWPGLCSRTGERLAPPAINQREGAGETSIGFGMRVGHSVAWSPTRPGWARRGNGHLAGSYSLRDDDDRCRNPEDRLAESQRGLIARLRPLPRVAHDVTSPSSSAESYCFKLKRVERVRPLGPRRDRYPRLCLPMAPARGWPSEAVTSTP